jgi:superfamily I DNA/RNA helicase
MTFPVAKTNGMSGADKLVKAIDAIVAKTGRTPTKYQTRVYQWLLEESGHAVVNAVAGSGKTSTLMDCVTAINATTSPLARPKILMLAFNSKITDELLAQISVPNCSAKTLNGLGHGILWKEEPVTLIADKTAITAKGIAGVDTMGRKAEKKFFMCLGPIKQLVSLFKGFGFGVLRDEPTAESVHELCERFGVELPDPSEISSGEFFDLLFKTWDAVRENTQVIDFDDQLYLPIYKELAFPTAFRFIFVDESQDLNPIQIEMVRRLANHKNRVVFFGDRNQAIYGFRGADPEAINTVIETFDATKLPLSICWRCPSSVVEAAKAIVPHIEPSPTAIAGKVDTVNENDFLKNVAEGDYVLCRTTAPLVEHCMDLIRCGIKAFVNGSDIGVGLKAMLDKIAKRGGDGEVWDQIEAYGTAELANLNKPGNETKVERFLDKIDTLKVLAESCKTVAEVKEKIDQIFANGKRGVMFSTIHRAKGLEADRVWILHPELLPHPMARKPWAREQERNLEYVAITRAMSELFWVEPTKPIKFGKFGA